MPSTTPLFISADHREKPSGIPAMLGKSPVSLTIESLPAGDYLINSHLLIERKSSEDFVQSLIQNRLFGQCSKLRQSGYIPLIIVEGNPFRTVHNISRAAVRGALISITTAWLIPVLFTRSPEDTFDLLLEAASQLKDCERKVLSRGYKPKSKKSKQLFFLQGIPSIGPGLASRLLERFGPPVQILNAPVAELEQVKGIGHKRALRIRKFLDTDQG